MVLTFNVQSLLDIEPYFHHESLNFNYLAVYVLVFLFLIFHNIQDLNLTVCVLISMMSIHIFGEFLSLLCRSFIFQFPLVFLSAVVSFSTDFHFRIIYWFLCRIDMHSSAFNTVAWEQHVEVL